MLVDSHAHLNFPEFASDFDNYLAKMRENKVNYALCVATTPNNINSVISIAEKYPNIFASVGVHPDEQLLDFEVTREFLLNFAKNQRVIAIGETGLDYYHGDSSDILIQKDRFIEHIEAAKISELPLIVHTRDAGVDTVDLLIRYNARQCGGVIHCFTETLEMAKKFLDLGFYLSFSGIVTFKNALQIQEVAKYIPLNRMLVETDAPFLAPVPFRGKLNHPALVIHTAEFIAKLRGISLEELARATTENFFTLFKAAKPIEMN